MQKPLHNSSLHSEGHLIIPTQEEIAKACPVTLSDEQENEFASWRVEFAAAVGATEEGGISAEAGSSGAGNAGGGGSATPPTLAPGTQADIEAALKEHMGTEFYIKNFCPKVVLLLPVR